MIYKKTYKVQIIIKIEGKKLKGKKEIIMIIPIHFTI